MVHHPFHEFDENFINLVLKSFERQWALGIESFIEWSEVSLDSQEIHRVIKSFICQVKTPSPLLFHSQVEEDDNHDDNHNNDGLFLSGFMWLVLFSIYQLHPMEQNTTHIHKS